MFEGSVEKLVSFGRLPCDPVDVVAQAEDRALLAGGGRKVEQNLKARGEVASFCVAVFLSAYLSFSLCLPVLASVLIPSLEKVSGALSHSRSRSLSLDGWKSKSGSERTFVRRQKQKGRTILPIRNRTPPILEC